MLSFLLKINRTYFYKLTHASMYKLNYKDGEKRQY